MFNSGIIEVAIGMIFIFLAVSLVCSAINEWIATLLNKRGMMLVKAVKNLLEDAKEDAQATGIVKVLYDHGLVKALRKGDRKFPALNWGKDKEFANISYLPANIFSTALIDIVLNKGEKGRSDLQGIERKIESLSTDENIMDTPGNQQAAKGVESTGNKSAESRNESPLISKYLKESLLALVEKTKWEAEYSNTILAGQVEIFKKNIENWFDEAMDRASGWYKRWTQIIVLIIAAVIVIVLNIDTITIAKRFYSDDALRAATVTAAEKAVSDSNGVAKKIDAAAPEVVKDVEGLNLPLGWTLSEDRLKADQRIPGADFGAWFLKITGLFITIAAVSLGAPFWFDTLSKFVNLRGAGAAVPGKEKSSG